MLKRMVCFLQLFLFKINFNMMKVLFFCDGNPEVLMSVCGESPVINTT